MGIETHEINARLEPVSLGSPPAGEATEGTLGDLNQSWSTMRTLLQRFSAQNAEINADERLAPPGRVEKLQKLAKEILGKVEALASPHRKALRRVEELEGEIDRALGRDDEPDAVAESRRRELRDHLLSLSADARQEALRQATEDGDVELIQSVTEAPQVIRAQLIRFEGEHEQLLDELRRRLAPDELEELKVLRTAARNFEFSRERFEGHIRAESGLEPSFDERVKAEAERKRAAAL